MDDWKRNNPAPLANIDGRTPAPFELVTFDTECETQDDEAFKQAVREQLQMLMRELILWVLEGDVTYQRYPNKVLRKLVAIAWFLKIQPFDTPTFDEATNGSVIRKHITKFSVFKYAHELQSHFGLTTPPR